MIQPTMRSFLLLSAALAVGDASLLSSHDNTRASLDPTCDACAFDGTDTDSCVVYGSLPHLEELIPWHKAPQNCLEHYKVHLQTVSLASLRQMWPRGYNAPPVLEQVMHFLEQAVPQPYQDDLHDIILYALSDFFVEVEGVLAFHPRVFVGVTQYECVDLESNCWTALRKYLGQSDEGARRAVKLGHELFKLSHSEQEKEQQNVRQMLCADVHGAESAESAASVCGPLATQVHDYWRGNTELSCQVFGEGAPKHLRDALPHHCVLDSGGGQKVSGNIESSAVVKAISVGWVATSLFLSAFGMFWL